MSALLTSRQSRWLTILVAVLLLTALLALGAENRRLAWARRGIPTELTGPMIGAGQRLGFNVTLPETETELRGLIAELKTAGVTTVKTSFYFSQSFDWATTDQQLALLEDAELELVPLLDGSPQNGFAPPADPVVFASWAASFAERYGATIDYYFIWDEPNLTSHWGNRPVNPDEYAALLATTSAAIKAVDSVAYIVAAPLAPTVEIGPLNLAPQLYLQRLYEADVAAAFDLVAGKPYGFDDSPWERDVDSERLNFSHIILLRETMVANGDPDKVIWAGNWGWHSLPPDWAGEPSLWGQIDSATRVEWTIAALERARTEWPWLGTMFLEHWQPDVDPTADPRWGFRVAGTPLAPALTEWLKTQPNYGFPGFHPARPDSVGQQYAGQWRFAPDLGADIGQSGDTVRFSFYGTDIGVRIRRADFRARFHVEVDGEAAPHLPQDESGAALVLTAPDPSEDYVTTVVVARDLPPGQHVVTLVADRGWDQWALRGFAVGYEPAPAWSGRSWLWSGLALAAALALVTLLPSAQWPATIQASGRNWWRLSRGRQLLMAGTAALIAGTTGWLTWGQQAEGLYRRLGDAGQLTLTATAAAVFYVAPSFYIYVAALVVLAVLLYLRPAWGLALTTLALPLYVLPKPMLGYRFSPVEFFVLLTFMAALAQQVTGAAGRPWPRWRLSDSAVLLFFLIASLSLAFTERLDVATNEWRVVILEPVLFYAAWRLIRPNRGEIELILDSFVACGLMVALVGLGQYVTGQNLITAEGGLLRLRSIYGSPNNVALLFDRILPFTLAFALLGKGWRRLVYSLAFLILAGAGLLTFSKGGLLLGFPTACGLVLLGWLSSRGRRIWPWLLGLLIAGSLAFGLSQQIPALAGRFDILGVTSDFRLNLWRSSLAMIREQLWWGVGLDNFLYAYRGRYILQAAWQEPNLNHPHNILLDYWTRLGLFGVLSGLWLWGTLLHATWSRWRAEPTAPLALGLVGAAGAMIAHGLVDHSFFLVDLALSFFLLLNLALSLGDLPAGQLAD